MPCKGKEDVTGMMERIMEECPNETMIKMMPGLMGDLIQRVPMAHRTDFALNTISALMNHGTAGMSEEEKKAFGELMISKLRS